MSPDPYGVTREFEKALCEYTEAKYACAVNSCSAALLLACQYALMHQREGIAAMGHYGHASALEIPRRTYVSVPMSIIHAGGNVVFRDEDWIGAYQLKPSPVWDCARRFTSGMYVSGQFQCVSFSSSKILGIEQGGAILHDNRDADAWFRKMRFDGRTEGLSIMEDRFDVIGHHCLMPPGIAAQLLLKLFHLPRHNEDLPVIEYPDLSTFEVFK